MLDDGSGAGWFGDREMAVTTPVVLFRNSGGTIDAGRQFFLVWFGSRFSFLWFFLFSFPVGEITDHAAVVALGSMIGVGLCAVVTDEHDLAN